MKTFKQLKEELNLVEDGEGGGEASNNTGAIPDPYVVTKKVAAAYKKKNATSTGVGRRVLAPV